MLKRCDFTPPFRPHSLFGPDSFLTGASHIETVRGDIMSKHDGRTVSVLYKLQALIAGLRRLGVQQVEADAVSGVQHVKWADPDLIDKLETERRAIDINTTTGLRGAIDPARPALPSA
jgi:hypothetical protein